MPFGSLWLPVLVSAVVMHVLGFLAWVVLPYNKKLWKGLPDEEAARRVLSLPPGQYRIPAPREGGSMKDPELIERYARGPVGTILIEKPGGMAMGRRIGLTFAWNLFIAIMTAYVLRNALVPATPFVKVFQIAGVTCFGFCGFATFQEAIWFSKSWARVGFDVLDALAYGLATGAIFAALWPA